jgi:CBS domain-containing protein
MIHAIDTIEYALEQLAKADILSAPVFTQEGIIGSVDILDILSFVCQLIEKGQHVEDFKEKLEKEFKKEVGFIMNKSKRDYWHSIPSKIDLHEAITKLADPNIHRLTVFDSENPAHVQGVLSQYGVLQFLNSQKPRLDERLKLKVRDVWPESRPVYTVKCTESVLSAFYAMNISKISGMAVVDESGKMVGNISASDIRHAGLPKYGSKVATLISDLNMTLATFIGLTPPEISRFPNMGPEIPSSQNLPKLEQKTVSWEDNLETILGILSGRFNSSVLGETHIHRVYVIDESGKPVRAITSEDLLAQFCM